MKLNRVAPLALLTLLALPAAALAAYQERWSADVSFDNSTLSPSSIGDLNGDCSSDEVVVNVIQGGTYHVQIRNLFTGAIQYTSVTGSGDLMTGWTFFIGTTSMTCAGHYLLASTGNKVLVIDFGGALAAPSNNVQGMREGLLPARPNPFRGDVALSYELAAPGKAEIEVFDVAGRMVRRLDGDGMTAGEHRVKWDGRAQDGHALEPGMYFYRLNVDGRASEARKAVRLDP